MNTTLIVNNMKIRTQDNVIVNRVKNPLLHIYMYMYVFLCFYLETTTCWCLLIIDWTRHCVPLLM